MGGALGIAVAWSLAFLEPTTAAERRSRAPEREPLTVDQLIANAASLDGKTVTVRGDLVIEPHNRLLWSKAGRNAGVRGRCIQYELTEQIHNEREQLNRTRVLMSGSVKVLCRGAECRAPCDGVALLNPRVIQRSEIRQTMRAGLRQEWSAVVDGSSPEGRSLYAFADAVRERLNAGLADNSLRSRVADLVPPEHRRIVATQLEQPGSRANRVLFDAPNSIGRSAQRQGARPVVIQTEVGPNKRTSICFCHGDRCDWTHLRPMSIGHRPASQAEICLPLREKAAQPALDAGYIVGAPYEDELTEPSA